MAVIRYIGPVRRTPTYYQHAGIRSMCAKFYKDRSKTEKLVSVATNRRSHRYMDGLTDGRTNRHAQIDLPDTADS